MRKLIYRSVIIAFIGLFILSIWFNFYFATAIVAIMHNMQSENLQKLQGSDKYLPYEKDEAYELELHKKGLYQDWVKKPKKKGGK